MRDKNGEFTQIVLKATVFVHTGYERTEAQARDTLLQLAFGLCKQARGGYDGYLRSLLHLYHITDSSSISSAFLHRVGNCTDELCLVKFFCTRDSLGEMVSNQDSQVNVHLQLRVLAVIIR